MRDWFSLLTPHRLIARMPQTQARRVQQRAAREQGRRGRGTLIPYLFLVLFMLIMSADVREHLFWTGPLCIGLLAVSIVRFLLAKRLIHADSESLFAQLSLYSHLSLLSAILMGLFASFSLAASGLTTTTMLILLASCGVTGAAIGTIAMFPRVWSGFLFLSWCPVMLTCCGMAVMAEDDALSLLFMIIFYVGFVNAVGRRTIHGYWQGQVNLYNLEIKTAALEQTLGLLEEKEQELRLHHDQLQDLVRQRTEDLLQAKNEAERANEAKGEFVSNITHELRTPVHAILSFSRFGVKRFETEPREKLGKYFSRIEQSGERLITLVDDVLNLAKFEASRMPLRFAHGNLNDLIQRRVEELEARLQESYLAVDFDFQEESLTAYVDQIFIGQVITNLLANAIKFSPPGSTITIASKETVMAMGRRADDPKDIPAIEIAITDQGIGIPRAELESVFDKFAQSSRSSNGTGGTGLGLSICRKILEAHRGRIWAESESGKGTKMCVLFPRDLSLLSDLHQRGETQMTDHRNDPKQSEQWIDQSVNDGRKVQHPFTHHAASDVIAIEDELTESE